MSATAGKAQSWTGDSCLLIFHASGPAGRVNQHLPQILIKHVVTYFQTNLLACLRGVACQFPQGQLSFDFSHV